MLKFAFFVVGLPHSGKEITANLLSHYLNVPRAASSSILFDKLAAERGVSRWELEADPRSEIKSELERLGDSICRIDPAALVAPLLEKGVRVIHGILRREELKAAREAARQLGLKPVVVWLDRAGSGEGESRIAKRDADVVIPNHGTVGYLSQRVEALAAEFSVTSFDGVEGEVLPFGFETIKPSDVLGNPAFFEDTSWSGFGADDTDEAEDSDDKPFWK